MNSHGLESKKSLEQLGLDTNTLDATNYMMDTEEELTGFKELTDQLMQFLQKGNFDGALTCINDINRINDDKLFRIIGKITRGLHNAISDLQLSSAPGKNDNNRTQTGLGYVIDVTADAAKTTLDMTEKARDALLRMNENLERQNAMLEQLQTAANDAPAIHTTVKHLAGLLSDNRQTVHEINGNVMEIIIAQNYQDLASQSIMKSISNIRGVETSLIALTKHTNLLKQISQFTSNPEKLNRFESEELCQNLGKLELKAENEHMNQDDVDNLLSSLGF